MPGFAERKFELNCVPKEIEELSWQLTDTYSRIPSVEIWNTECINSVISQVEFYKNSGFFSSSADVKTVYESLEETLLHLKSQVEYGCKFMPNESLDNKKNNFSFFYNRVVLGDNTILVITDRVKTVFLNYDVLNYIQTRDETFCGLCYVDI